MKFILIAFFLNLANPSEPSLFAHKVFESKAACVEMVSKMPEPPKGIKASYFCVSEDDLLDVKNHA